MKDRSSNLWKKANKMLIHTTHFKVTTISAGCIYEFRVYAENAAGIGKPSHPSEPVLATDWFISNT
jgi:titin